MKNKLRCGIISRVDNSGLSNLSYDFWKHIFEITKSLTVLSSRPYQNVTRYPEQIICDGLPTLEQIDLFLKDIDIVLAFETPYNWNIFSKAKEKGVKTILMPMYEWTEEIMPFVPDLILCPSLLDYDIYKDYPTRVEYMPVPIDRKLFPFKQRKKVETFLFNNGYGGSMGRNGLEVLLKAIPLVKSEVDFIINSQVPIPKINDERIFVNIKNVKDRKDLFKEGDVLILPRMFGALSLPTWEALSCGMPVLSTDLYPFNSILPKDWFFKPDKIESTRTSPKSRMIDYAVISPLKLAEKIDEWGYKDITEDSKKADEISEKISWKNMYPKYIELLNDLIK